MAVRKLVDRQWVDDRVQGGLSSGEGLINVVRDPTMKWDREAQAEVELDHGVDDKRLLVIEPEFAGVLAVMERAGNTISPLIREALTEASCDHLPRVAAQSTNAPISVIRHITENDSEHAYPHRHGHVRQPVPVRAHQAVEELPRRWII